MNDFAHQHRKYQHHRDRDPKRQQVSGADGTGHGRVKSRGAGRGNRGQLPRVQPTELMQKPKPALHQQDREIRRMVEVKLRVAVVQQQDVVDDHEVHIGIAPIDDEITHQKKRSCQQRDDEQKTCVPAKRRQPPVRIRPFAPIRLGLADRSRPRRSQAPRRHASQQPNVREEINAGTYSRTFGV